jgi:hypothetical protein
MFVVLAAPLPPTRWLDLSQKGSDLAMASPAHTVGSTVAVTATPRVRDFGCQGSSPGRWHARLALRRLASGISWDDGFTICEERAAWKLQQGPDLVLGVWLGDSRRSEVPGCGAKVFLDKSLALRRQKW